MSPKISIIVPVYNVEKYLEQCIESLIDQTYENIEIICVNDGSLDRSLEILETYALKDKRIKVVSKENGGLSDARNYGHQFVSGEYLMYVDSDDWIDLETCEAAINKMIQEDADVVFWNYIRETGNSSNPRYIFGENEKIFEKNEINKLQRRFLGLYGAELRYPERANSLDTAWGKLYRSKIILDNDLQYVDTKIIGTEDALFNLYVFGYVSKAVYMKACFSHYRRDNAVSLTKTYKPMLKKQWDNLHAYMKAYISKVECDESYQAALYNRICLSIIGLGLNVLRADISEYGKVKKIKEIIYSDDYRIAIKQLQLKYFPLHWKVFFGLAKYKCVLGVYCMLILIKKLKGN